MRRVLILEAFALVLLLTWLGSASETSSPNRPANIKRLAALRRARLNRARLHPGAMTRSATGAVPHSADPADGPSEARARYEVMQKDESTSAPNQAAAPRRVMARRRPLQGGNPLAGHAAPHAETPVVGHTMVQDEGTPGSRARVSRMPSSAGSPNLLATFAGKNRLLVISAPHDSDGYYRLMMSLLKDDVYCELAERHVHQIVMFHQEGEQGGKVRRITNEGKVMEEPLDVTLIPRLMSFLKLEKVCDILMLMLFNQSRWGACLP